MFLRRRHLFVGVVATIGFTIFHLYYSKPVSKVLGVEADLTPSHKFTSTQLPQTAQAPPANYTNISKLLVIASQKKDDTSWIDELVPDWPYVRYITDEPQAKYKVPKNKGNEAMVYLTFVPFATLSGAEKLC
jgi:hypothetical protein